VPTTGEAAQNAGMMIGAMHVAEQKNEQDDEAQEPPQYRSRARSVLSERLRRAQTYLSVAQQLSRTDAGQRPQTALSAFQ
jgi:hypothetical protein